ncbi:MAG TPA: flagellar hook-length control protein FliK [Rhizomicrobium sp.]|nr:flagellar hook-length control protein FliK [Rhizomicrobium sp.]
MRASATSRTNSPANIPAAQAKADANRADAASPFALLMEMATAKNGAKPAQKDAKDSGDTPANDKPAIKQNDGKRNGVNQDDNAAAAQMAPRPAASAKPGKPDKNKDGGAIQTGEDETVQTAPDDKQASAIEQQMSDQQALPPAPVVQTSAPAPIPAIADTDDDLTIDGAAPITTVPAPSSGTDFDAPDLVGASAKPEASATAQSHAAPQTPIAALADDGQSEETQLPASAAAQARAVLAARDQATQPGDKPSTPPVTPRANVKPDAANTDSAANDAAASDAITADAGKDASDIAKTQANPAAKNDLAKNDAIKNGPAKDHVAQNDVTKTDASRGDTGKSDDTTASARPDPVPAERDDVNGAAAPRPAPQPAQVSNAGFAINNIAAPQAAQHSQAPIAIQHVQVTAQAAPNLPALAVEIAAKSQSGAKQFDIRLDPPELGRVDVRLSIDATGKASAHLSADQPQTLSLLQKDAPILTRALREAGLDVSQDGLNFSLRHQSGGQNGNDSNNGRFGSARSFSLAATASIDPTTAIAYRGMVDGRLDIRV